MVYDPHKHHERHYDPTDKELAIQFSTLLKKELHELLTEVIFFGSAAKNPESELFGNDIDVLVIIDDRIRQITQESVEAYRIITNSCASKTSKRLHINTLRLSNFLEYVLNGDPIATNILRDGQPLLNAGIVETLQALQHRGEIRPSEEVIWTYFNKAPETIIGSKQSILQATIDLYWACIEASNSILQKMGETPHTPEQAIHLINTQLVRSKKITPKTASILPELYTTEKKINNRDIKDISGKAYQQLNDRAKAYLDELGAISGSLRFSQHETAIPAKTLNM